MPTRPPISPTASPARLAFGTAGLRGELGAGSNRMNRVLVAQAAAGLAAFVRERAADRGPRADRGDRLRRPPQLRRVRAGLRRDLRGCRAARDPAPAAAADARARVRRAPPRRGRRRHGDREPQPAERQRLQGLPRRRRRRRADRLARRRRDRGAHPADRGRRRRRAPCPARSATRRRPSRSSRRTSTATAAVAPAPDGAEGMHLGLHRDARRRVGDALAHPRGRPATPRPRRSTAQLDPDGAFPTVAFPNPEEPGAMDLAFETARSVERRPRDRERPRRRPARGRGARPARVDGGWRRLTGNQIGLLLGWRAARLAPRGGRARPARRSPARSSPRPA